LGKNNDNEKRALESPFFGRVDAVFVLSTFFEQYLHTSYIRQKEAVKHFCERFFNGICGILAG
jgi:hypothetical protein